MIPSRLLGRAQQLSPSGEKNSDNLKGVEKAEESMMKELKDYATEDFLQPG